MPRARDVGGASSGEIGPAAPESARAVPRSQGDDLAVENDAIARARRRERAYAAATSGNCVRFVFAVACDQLHARSADEGEHAHAVVFRLEGPVAARVARRCRSSRTSAPAERMGVQASVHELSHRHWVIA